MAFVLAWIVVLAVPQESSRGLEQVAEAVRKREYAEAERLCQAHLSKNPGDSLGWFYLGFSLAARKDYAAALPHYQKAVGLGLDRFKGHYQLGYCAHRLEKYSLAEESFGRALVLKPDDSDALYHLGIAQARQGKHVAAERTFTKLLEQPSRWTELAHFERGLARRHLGRSKEAGEDLQWVVREGEDERLKPRARDLLQPSSKRADPASKKRWNVTLLEKAGYDSNVLLLPDTSLTRPTEDGDTFLMSYLSGSLDLVEDRLLTARLSVLDVSYADLHAFTQDAVLFEMENETPLGRDWACLFSGEGNLYYQGHDSLLREAKIEGGIRWAWGRRDTVATGGQMAKKDYRRSDINDLDSIVPGAFAEVRVGGIADWLEGRLRYEIVDEAADADDRSYLQQRLRLRTDVKLGSGLEVRLEGRVRRREYEATDRFYLATRDDTRWEGQASISWTLWKHLRAFLEGEVQQNNSNIPDFDYEREVVSAGFLLFF